MLPKKERFTRKSFSELVSHAARAKAEHVSVTYRHTTDPLKKVSFVISKKVAKSAVARNALRRRGYHAVSSFDPNLLSGLKVIFFFNKGVETLSYPELEGEIHSLLDRIKK